VALLAGHDEESAAAAKRKRAALRVAKEKLEKKQAAAEATAAKAAAGGDQAAGSASSFAPAARAESPVGRGELGPAPLLWAPPERRHHPAGTALALLREAALGRGEPGSSDGGVGGASDSTRQKRLASLQKEKESRAA